jgi:hypothetical protein
MGEHVSEDKLRCGKTRMTPKSNNLHLLLLLLSKRLLTHQAQDTIALPLRCFSGDIAW